MTELHVVRDLSNKIDEDVTAAIVRTVYLVADDARFVLGLAAVKSTLMNLAAMLVASGLEETDAKRSALELAIYTVRITLGEGHDSGWPDFERFIHERPDIAIKAAVALGMKAK